MNEVSQTISRRDFLKLKSLLVVWLYFLQTFGFNVLANESKKIDYSILDELKKLPFGKDVKEEVEFRIKLQKKYCYDANGKLHPLDRFLKETINFIISQKDIRDFKLLNSIKDEQIDLVYMFNATAKHNQLKSMKFLQKKLLSNKNNQLLSDALEYAVKSQSVDTTLHLMKQKISLNAELQKSIINTLQQEEYEPFYKRISSSNNKLLLPYQKTTSVNKRFIAKKEVKSTLGSEIYYKYEDELFAIVYNATADLYMKYLIDYFSVNLSKEKIDVHIWNHSGVYSIDFLSEYQMLIKCNGFDREIIQKDSYYQIDSNDFKSWEWSGNLNSDTYFNILRSHFRT